MSGKRALVVDDSKSARAFLSRLLEKHDLEVDTAESAEQAIDYLTRHAPDVIFMDHLMPGMDGFQAVQAIKNNPRTATIPILMYTSQEGELYLGQARALGAVGVLPKQIAPADVKKVLHQLKLVPDLRSHEPAFRTVEELSHSAGASGAPQAADRDADAVAEPDHDTTIAALPANAVPHGGGGGSGGGVGDVLLRDQIAELRRYLSSGLDDQSTRIVEQLSEVIRAAAPSPPAPPVVDRRGWQVAAAAGVVALVFAGLWWREASERRDLQQRLGAATALRPVPSDTVAKPAADVAVAGELPASAASPAPAVATAEPGTNAAGDLVVAVPYGEAPFAGGRTERLRTLVAELATSNFRGRLDLRGHSGRFCLTGNATEGFSLASPDLPQAQCDLVGNPAEDGRQPRESVGFADAVTELRRLHAGRIAIEVDLVREEAIAQPYPEAAPGAARAVTAGEWNAAALANNRVVIRWSAAP